MPAEKPESARGRKPAPKPAVKRRPAVTAPAAATAPEAVAAPATSVLPDDERDAAIRQAAYARYQARGCVSGHELEDWLEAEAQVRRARGDAPAAAWSRTTPR